MINTAYRLEYDLENDGYSDIFSFLFQYRAALALKYAYHILFLSLTYHNHLKTCLC